MRWNSIWLGVFFCATSTVLAQQAQVLPLSGYWVGPASPAVVVTTPIQPNAVPANLGAIPPLPYGYPVFPPYPPAQPTAPAKPDMSRVIPAGRLIVKVEPGDSTVYVDGYQLVAAQSNTYEIGLLIGKHRLEVRRQNYTEYVNDFEVETNKAVLVTVSLRKSH